MDNSDNNPPASLTIQDLPNELLSEILKWLTGLGRGNRRDLENALQVCQRWYAIVDGWIGRFVTCSEPMLIHPSNPDRTKKGLELISEIGVRLFEIERAGNENLLEPPSTTHPSFKHPHLLRFLLISKAIHPDLFNNLVKDTINLCGISISLVALSQLRNSDLKQLDLKFPRLKILGVHTFTVRYVGLDTWAYSDPSLYLDEVAALPNVRTLIGENKFPNLSMLYFGFQVTAFQDLETIKILVPFIQGHPALTDLSIEMIFPNETIPVDKLIYHDELKSILQVINPEQCCTSLKTLRFRARAANGQYRFGNYPQLEVWKEFLLKLKPRTLTELSLEFGLISNELIRTIFTQHGSTLQKLILNLRPSADWNFEGIAGLQLDFSALPPLQCLLGLELEMQISDEIIGISNLPTSLVDVSLTGKMKSDECHALLLRLPNLRRITYINYWNHFNNDDDEGYTVRIDTLRQFVENRKVEYVHLCDYILEKNFPPEGIPNGDPENPSLLTYSVDNYCISWKLNPMNYYVSLGGIRAVAVDLDEDESDEEEDESDEEEDESDEEDNTNEDEDDDEDD